MSVDLMDHVFRSLEKHFPSATPTLAATVCKPLSQDKNEVSPTAGIGTADAGLPIVRYWTVKFERGGRTHWTAVEACDVLKANLVTFKKHEGASAVVVVREIRSDEFEALTRSSP
jgi:hypothetical protein